MILGELNSLRVIIKKTSSTKNLSKKVKSFFCPIQYLAKASFLQKYNLPQFAFIFSGDIPSILASLV